MQQHKDNDRKIKTRTKGKVIVSSEANLDTAVKPGTQRKH